MQGKLLTSLAQLLDFPQAEEKGTSRMRRGDVACVPFAALDEQILALIETKERNRNELAVLVLAQENRIFALNLLKLARDDERLIHIVQFGGSPMCDAQGAVLDIIQRYPVRHVPPFPNA